MRKQQSRAGVALASRASAPTQNQPKIKSKARRPRRRPRRAARLPRNAVRQGLSSAGRRFLACAFAPPDFNNDPGVGIPDEFDGKVLMRKHVLTTAIAPTANKQTLYIIAPTPGIAYFSAETTIGNSFGAVDFTGVAMPGYSTLFPTTGNSNANVTAFRYASMCAGLYPTGNLTQMAGSIQVYKAKLSLTRNYLQLSFATSPPVAVPMDTPAIEGLEAVDNVPSDNFSVNFAEGCFSQSVNNQPEFEFLPITEGYANLPLGSLTRAQAGMYTALLAPSTTTINGLGSMDAIMILVTSPASSVNAAILKVWSCVEYKPNSASTLYEFCTQSPSHDPTALAAYRGVASSIPVAVRAVENANFWNRIKMLLNKVLGATSYIPGPVGAASAGINAATNAIAEMFI
jgi:hypothetical protein